MSFFKKFPKSFFLGTKMSPLTQFMLGAHLGLELPAPRGPWSPSASTHVHQALVPQLQAAMVLLVGLQTSIVVIISVKKLSPPMDSISQSVGPTLATKNVTGEQPLKLAHSLLGYAVGMTDINRPGWPITRKQTHRNKF